MRNWLGIEPQEIWSFALVGTLFLIIVGPAWSHNWDRRECFWASTFGLVGALWGGHLLVLLSQPSLILEDPLRLLNFLDGAKGVFGAFIGAAIGGGLYLLYRREPLLAYADAAVPAVFLGYAVARIGCFLNGDAFGTVTTVPWAVRFPQGTEAFAHHYANGWVSAQEALSLPVHPTQVYHMAVGLLIFIVLSRIRNARRGTRLAVGLVGYGALRFVLEFFRGDAVPIWHGLDLNQLLCVAMIGIGVLVRVFRPADERVCRLSGQPV